jgi:hypothetical protein
VLKLLLPLLLFKLQLKFLGVLGEAIVDSFVLKPAKTTTRDNISRESKQELRAKHTYMNTTKQLRKE